MCPPSVVVKDAARGGHGRRAGPAIPSVDAPAGGAVILERFAHLARSAWPSLDLDGERFLEHVKPKIPSGSSPEKTLAGLVAGDLYLAFGCVEHHPPALAVFEESYLTRAGRVLVQARVPRDVSEEVVQILRVRLLVGKADGRAAIADYGGRGDLWSWVRVAALREALRHLHRSRRSLPLDDSLIGRAAAATDPEAEYLYRAHGQDFKRAFQQAFYELTARQRNLLRQQLLFGVTIDQLAALYRVHRATIARWVSQAREQLIASTRLRFASDLRLTASQAHSLVTFLSPLVELSLHRLLDQPDASH